MEERNKYSVIGQVTIGTDEYRDLVEGKLTAEKEASEYRSKCWRYESEIKELHDRIAGLEAKIGDYKKFVASSVEISTAYNQYIVNKVKADE